MMNKETEKLLFNPIRLKAISFLISVEKCNFKTLIDVTDSTKGNLSIQLKKLNEAWLIDIKKYFYNSYPRTDYSITKKGKKGAEEIQTLMQQARENPQKTINGFRVVQIDDYLASTSKNTETNTLTTLGVPKANVLIFTTADGSKIALRPSGTEPKIKYYISVNELLENSKDFDAVHKKLEDKIDAIINSMELL